jgi:hypothetical protein
MDLDSSPTLCEKIIIQMHPVALGVCVYRALRDLVKAIPRQPRLKEDASLSYSSLQVIKVSLRHVSLIDTALSRPR